jgi:hypothetical protein
MKKTDPKLGMDMNIEKWSYLRVWYVPKHFIVEQSIVFVNFDLNKLMHALWCRP